MIHLSANPIAALHDRTNHDWHLLQHQQPEPLADEDLLTHAGAVIENDNFLGTVTAQHLANFRLWHLEDTARVRSAPDSVIANAKRSIDRVNQQRNDLAEQLDLLLTASLAESGWLDPGEAVRLHSESPGMMIDRLSILSLKLYHTQEEIERVDAPPGHAEQNAQRLRILHEQRTDLAACLDQLWRAVETGERRFKVYHQLKMYNDPSLNPALYNEQRLR